jgi:hypothetical protein
VDAVVSSLHVLFADGDAAALLTTVNLACAAPAPPGGYPPDPADAEDEDGDGPVRTPARDGAETVTLRTAGQHRAARDRAAQDQRGPDQRTPDRAEPCPRCDENGGQPVHGALDSLVRALWQGSDPLAPPDEDTTERVDFALGTLAQYSTGHARSVYFKAHTEWPRALRGWTRAPGLPTAAHQGGHA